MKHTTFLTLVVFLAVFLVPTTPASALSCIDPEGMIQFIVESDEFMIVTATPTEQKEHVKEAADQSDPNKSYPAGYSAQFLDITVVHKGSVQDSLWAYFERNGTWNYLCVSGPAPLDSEQVYVLSQSSDLFGLTSVVAVYEADSDMAKTLLKEVADAETEETPEATMFEAGKEYWMQNLYDQLKEMAFIVEVKFAEWKFWLAQ